MIATGSASSSLAGVPGPLHVLLPAAAVVSGIGWGMTTTLYARAVLLLGPLTLPLGLVAAALATAAFVAAWGALAGSPRLRLAAAVGWFVGFAVLVPARREGDVVVAADWLGYGWLLLGPVSAAAGAALPLARRPPPITPDTPDRHERD